MAPTGTIPSPDLIWLCIRKGNSYTVKRPGAGKVFSKERGNLSNVHSYAASGLANKNVVHIAPSPAGRGVTISKRKEGASVFENKSAVEKKSVKGNTSFRKTAGAITQVNKSEGGRPDLQKVRQCCHLSQDPHTGALTVGELVSRTDRARPWLADPQVADQHAQGSPRACCPRQEVVAQL